MLTRLLICLFAMLCVYNCDAKNNWMDNDQRTLGVETSFAEAIGDASDLPPAAEAALNGQNNQATNFKSAWQSLVHQLRRQQQRRKLLANEEAKAANEPSKMPLRSRLADFLKARSQANNAAITVSRRAGFSFDTTNPLYKGKRRPQRFDEISGRGCRFKLCGSLMGSSRLFRGRRLPQARNDS